MNLHHIFQYLVDDPAFLTITEMASNQTEKKFSTIVNIFSDNKRLDVGETQDFNKFPKILKSFLTKNHYRIGINHTMEKNMSTVNVSLITSLNMLVRPELARATGMSWTQDRVPRDQEHPELQHSDFSITPFETYLSHNIRSNCQIDKTKNTCKTKNSNKILADDMLIGNIYPEIIQRLVNILEINLVIFDLDRSVHTVYWSSGIKYPHINPFRRLYAICMVQNSYEPILIRDVVDYKQLYGRIMGRHEEFQFYPDLKLGAQTLLYLNSWDISNRRYASIISRFFPPTISDLDEYYDSMTLM